MSNEKKSVAFKSEYMNILNLISAGIDAQVVVRKSEDGESIVVQRSNVAESISYTLTAPLDNFDFSGEEIAFYDFKEMYQLITSFDSPILTQSDDSKLTISKNKANIQYLLSDEETLRADMGEINFEKPDVTFAISETELKDIRKMIGLLATENCNFKCDKDSESITIKLFNEKDNSYDNEIALTECNDEIDMNISSEIFSVIPSGDYKVEIKSEGVVKFTLNNSISLVIYTAELVD